MAASTSIFPAVSFTWVGDEKEEGEWEAMTRSGGGWTDELMAFCCVLQDYSLARIVLRFPEDISQILEANVN